METVRRVLLDESLLCGKDALEEDNWHLLPGAAMLLLRLQHSKLHVGICYEEGAALSKVNFLLRVVAAHSFEPVCWTSNFLNNSSYDLSVEWTSSTGSNVYATSRDDSILHHKLWNNGWKIILKGVSNDLVENESLLFIERLDELLITLCRFNKMGTGNEQNVIVGYIMKQSREKDFLKRGAFPMCPTENGLVFVPIIMEISLAYQMQIVDALLHKATDEIIKIHLSNMDFSNEITYSKGMEELERYVKVNPHCCIIDPLNKVCPLVDRLQIQQILHGLDDLDSRTKCKIRAPRFLKVDNFQEPKLNEKLLELKLSFPCIVKPQAACGVAHAHSMALVFKAEDFENLQVPLPAIIQEYVDHGSIIYKVYVLGERVFYAIKRSMPNGNLLSLNSEKNSCGPILFDSLKSLPTEKGAIPMEQKCFLDLDLINIAAKWLRGYLDLTIFGFDVVIQEGCGDHVIVDVNYLPSFKEVPDFDAIPAFWDAIKRSYESRKLSQPLVCQ